MSRFGALLDQALNAASSIVLVMALALATTPGDFGALSFAVLSITVPVSMLRGSLGVWIASVRGAVLQQVTSQVLGFVLVISLVMALVGGVSARIFLGPGTLTDSFIIIISALVPAAALDILRYMAFSARRDVLSLAANGLWLLAIIVPWLLLLAGKTLSAGLVGTAYVAGATMGAFLLAGGLRVVPRRGFRSIAPQIHGLRSLTSQGILSAIQPLVVSGLSGLLVGLIAVGALRASSTLLGPLNVLYAAVPLLLLPQLRDSPLEGRRLTRSYVGGLLAVCAVGEVAVHMLPQSVGEILLGETWSGARVVLPIMLIEYAVIALAIYPRTLMLAEGRFSAANRAKVVHFVLTLLAITVVASFVNSPAGLAWALVGGAFAYLMSLLALMNGAGSAEAVPYTDPVN